MTSLFGEIFSCSAPQFKTDTFSIDSSTHDHELCLKRTRDSGRYRCIRWPQQRRNVFLIAFFNPIRVCPGPNPSSSRWPSPVGLLRVVGRRAWVWRRGRAYFDGRARRVIFVVAVSTEEVVRMERRVFVEARGRIAPGAVRTGADGSLVVRRTAVSRGWLSLQARENRMIHAGRDCLVQTID